MNTVAPLILAVDDEPGILRLLKLQLAGDGFRVIAARSGEEALELAESLRPDLVILDILMPEMNGLEVMRLLRRRSSVPVLILTGKDGTTDLVTGLELGADDYLVKPFNPEELGARLRALLRRTSGRSSAGETVVRAGKVEIDLERRLVRKDGEPVRLTRMEWLLLQQLAGNAGKVMLNAELLSRVWGPEYRDDAQYLRVCISRLRGKLEHDPSDPKLITTMPGIGYQFASPDGDPAVRPE